MCMITYTEKGGGAEACPRQVRDFKRERTGRNTANLYVNTKIKNYEGTILQCNFFHFFFIF